MHDSDTLSDLLRRCRVGDGQALGLIFGRFAERLARVAERQLSARVARREGPDDVVQSVFRTFYRRSTQGELQINDATHLWHLLRVRPPERFGQVELLELAHNLDHPQLAIRHLAGWHLYVAMASLDPSPIPAEAWKIHFSPIAPSPQRAEAVRQWERVKVVGRSRSR